MVRDIQINFDSAMFRKSLELLLSVGVSRGKAIELASNHFFRQIYNMVEYAKPGRNPGGMIIDGFRYNWSIPNVLTPEIQEKLITEWSIKTKPIKITQKLDMKALGERVEEMKKRDILRQNGSI